MRLALNASVYSNGVAVKEEICRAMDLIDEEHKRVAHRDAWFTSICDGVHREGSRHYLGLAVDVRIWYVPDPQLFTQRIKAILGPDYNVLLEKDHIHVSFKPQRR